MYRAIIGFTLCLMTLLSIFGTTAIHAQEQNGWSAPFRLSSGEGNAKRPFMISDSYGYLHTFWVETGLPNDRAIIQYSRFDGDSWSVPLDIYVARGSIGFLSPAIDGHGYLNLIWSGGDTGPIFLARAPVNNAMSAKMWSKPIRIPFPATQVRLQIDSNDVFHILYANSYGGIPGVYYTRSIDRGQTWAEEIWLDPDIPPGLAPWDIQLALDENNNLHAGWNYIDFEDTQMKALRYAHSLDNGNTWSLPFDIDEPDESESEVRLARPNLIVDGQTVHFIWAGTEETNREHRYSTNYGQTWGVTFQIFGGLHGEAIGDGLAIDSIGRIHFVGQIRYPQGIYHAYWDKDHWSNPSMIYLIAADSEADLGDRIHAHHVRLGIRNGNQLVITFTNSPGEGKPLALYAMHHTLDDAPPLSPLPTPTPEPTATLKPQTNLLRVSEAVTPIPTRPKYTGDATPPVIETSSPGYPLWLGLAPVVLILGGAVTFQLIRKW